MITCENDCEHCVPISRVPQVKPLATMGLVRIIEGNDYICDWTIAKPISQLDGVIVSCRGRNSSSCLLNASVIVDDSLTEI